MSAPLKLAIAQELHRVRALLRDLEGTTGRLPFVLFIRQSISNAERAIAAGDHATLRHAFHQLRNIR